MSSFETWHVTVTCAGPSRPLEEVHAAIQRLVEQQPFLLTCRYDMASAEVTYWDQGAELDDVAALALRLWGEHRTSAQLPPWHIVGLQVIDRATYRHRRSTSAAPATLESASKVAPF